MPNIIQRIGSNKTSVQQLYDSISSTTGLSNWWTKDVSGESKIGSVIQFRFSKGGPDFEVIDMQNLKRVEWKCVQGPKEWIDTHIEFDILNEQDEIILLFKHSGWREEVEFMHHCSTQWAYFLIGLRRFLETGEETPYGKNFEPISNWSK